MALWRQDMWRLALAIAGMVALASCGAAGTAGGGGGSKAATPSAANAAQAMAAALAFAAHSDPDVAIVDGYVTLPSAVQRGQQPIDLTGGHTNPCARPPKQPFTARERAALGAAFQDRKVSLIHDPAATLRTRAPGALLLVATQPLLGDQRGTVMVISCVPNPQQILVKVHWDGHAWQPTATGAGTS
jgi:hypothetical protein